VAPEGATEIIKCHDDFEDDDSLVLTESSYFQRMQFDTSLDLRLWSDSLGRMLLFVGYSLHDIETGYLLSRLQELWRNSPHVDQRPSSYILMPERTKRRKRCCAARVFCQFRLRTATRVGRRGGCAGIAGGGSREGEHTRAAAETAQAIKKTVRVPNESSVKHTMFRGTSIIKPQLVFTGNKTSGNFRILLYL